MAALVACATILGVCGGFILPVWLWRHLPGFVLGVAAGAVPTALAALMAAYVVAGLGEEWLGTDAGVPLGLLIGTFTSSFVLNGLAGVAGCLVASFFRRVFHRRKNGGGHTL